MATLTIDLKTGDVETPYNLLTYKLYGSANGYATPIATFGSADADPDVTVAGQIATIINVNLGTETSFKVGIVDQAGNESDLSDAYAINVNVVVNGDFSQGTTGWTLTGEATITDKLNLVRVGSSYTSGVQTISGSIGKTYNYSFNAVVNSGAGVFYLGDTNYVYVDETRTWTGQITNTGLSNDLKIATSGVANLTIDNISLIEA